jgi:hypothetical protein
VLAGTEEQRGVAAVSSKKPYFTEESWLVPFGPDVVPMGGIADLSPFKAWL